MIPYSTTETLRVKIPLVSIIVPTYNSERTIARCLDSLRHQTYGDTEIIVVDKGSSDRTKSICQDSGVLFYEVAANERSEQKDFGIRRAKGKYIYIVDSDFVLEPSVVQQAVDRCEYDGFHAVCVHNSSDPTVSFWSRVRKLERDMYVDDELNASARFVRKDVYEAIGGLDGKLIAAEDYDFQNRLARGRYKVGRIQAKEIHIGEPMSLTEVVKKHFYYGRTLPRFVRKNRSRGLEQLSPLRPSYLRHWKDFAANPSLAVGFAFYEYVRYASAVFGYLAGEYGNERASSPR